MLPFGKQLGLLVSSILLLQVSAIKDKGAIEPGFDGSLNHIQYQPWIPPTEPRFVAERERVLQHIAKPPHVLDFNADTPRNYMLYAMYSFMRHGVKYTAEVDRWRDRYETELSEKHKEVFRAILTMNTGLIKRS
jgi:hypothetical protein